MTELPKDSDNPVPHDTEPGRRKKSRSVQILTASAGISVGVVCLWLVLRGSDIAELKAALLAADLTNLAVALIMFWFSIVVRVVRWHRLLVHVAPIRRRHVAESAIVGYAASIVMPARLGEPFRAEYTQRRFHLDRYAVFGSIITERLIDAISVVVILLAGLVLVARHTLIADSAQLSAVATTALAIIAVTVVILIILRFRHLTRIQLPHWLDEPIRKLLSGVASLNQRNIASVLVFTLLIWSFETGALWAVFHSLGTNLSVGQLLLLAGIAALSTLIPAAPGYIGSLQLVFSLGMVLMKLPAAPGVLAATIVQLLFYGSLIIAATLVPILRGYPGVARRQADR